MRNSPSQQPHPAHSEGFSLIVTVVLMVLLSLVAVGIMTLSTTVLRSTSADNAHLEAEANARLALRLAIGQLQQSAGPDQRITASGNLVNPNNPAGLTGVWESQKLSPDGNPELEVQKTRTAAVESSFPDGEFVTWLNSDSYLSTPTREQPFTDASGSRATLLTFPDDPGNNLEASVVDLVNGGAAWATIDESVKARINLADQERAANVTDDQFRRTRLRAPFRMSTELIPNTGPAPTLRDAVRTASFEQGRILSGTTPDIYRSMFNDLTASSEGLQTNVVDGGLKRDLTVAFEREVPSNDLLGLRLYSENTQPIAPADPFLSSLRDYYRLYRQFAAADTPILPSRPPNYDPFVEVDGEQVPIPTVAEGQILAPVVSRVSIVFSLMNGPVHLQQRGSNLRAWPSRRGGRSSKPNLVYFFYGPVITLYNPYNRPINLSGVQVSFKGLPVGFRFYRNGEAMTRNFANISQMHLLTQGGENLDESGTFNVTLAEELGSGGANTSLILEPGEARVFGTNHLPDAPFFDGANARNDVANFFFTNSQGGSNSQFVEMNSAQGFTRGIAGFLTDWVRPSGAIPAGNLAESGVMALGLNDTLDVEISPVVPRGPNGPLDSFTVSVQADVGGSGTPETIAAYRYRYGTEARLREILELGEHPTIGRISYPRRLERPLAVGDFFEPSFESTGVANWNVQDFAVFTLASRTSNDSLFPSKPGVETAFNHNLIDMDVTEAHPAQVPMEMSLLPVRIGSGGSTDGPSAVEVYGVDDPRTFFFSGQTARTGFANFPSVEIPDGPLTNLVQLRNANLVSSGHLPIPGQTVGDSHAHPLLPRDVAIDTNSQFDYTTVDHSWLANNALYDRFFLSGITTREEFQLFLDSQPIPYNNRSLAYRPEGISDVDALALYEDEAGWRTSAAFQLLQGPFNVNSTSVEAWKAVLGSNLSKEVPIVNPRSLEVTFDPSVGTPLPRMLNAPVPPEGDINFAKQRDWTKFRDLDEAEITTLAERVVELVRERGPFTSLSEFVNRRLSNDAATSSQGLLQQAIEDTGLNDSFPFEREVIDVAGFDYSNPDAALGNTEAAAANVLTQSDILQSIGNALTVRGDTFKIRGYGESRNRAGRILATAVCEAVVQRVPDFVAPEDRLDAQPMDFAFDSGVAITDPINERLGRRFVIKSFRWLADNEI